MHRKKVIKEVVHIVVTCSDEELSFLNIGELAKKLGRNRWTLSRDFKKHTNLLLRDYIVREKILRITKVLETCDSPCIHEISKQFGFKNIDTFIKNFKNFYYTTPYQYWKLKQKQ